jgi:predicted  nucleic acid-binding Zn-ribbon protein
MKDKNPFEGIKYPLPKKPIEIAMDEIKVLKKTIVDLRKELEPLKQDLKQRQEKIELEEAEYEKIVKNSWW